MKKKMKSMVALMVVLTTMLAVSAVAYGAWQSKKFTAGSVTGEAEVGYSGYTGYAEVSASGNVYADMKGEATYYIMGVETIRNFSGGFDEDTYRQIKVTCPNPITAISCNFKVVSDDGRWEERISK